MFRQTLENPRNVLVLILMVTIFALFIDLPAIPINFEYKDYKINTSIGGDSLRVGKYQKNLKIKKGLDIAGGVSVLLQADMSKVESQDRQAAIDSLKEVIERRVNLLGISESNVQTSQFGEDYRVIVELAGVFDTTQALGAIGQVAQLSFRTEGEPKEITVPAKPIIDTNLEDGITPEVIPQTTLVPTFEPTDLTGADLKRATVTFGQANGGLSNEPQVSLQFNSEGIRKFRKITEENVGKRIAIYLDEQPIMAPVVNEPIVNGQAVITGGFTIDQANALVVQLNAGALPVPVKVLEQRTVGPTLGQESVDKSIYAGMVGLALVIGFMIFYYGRFGMIASIALAIYGIITLALYKLIPVVLTLPGLAGFILSIGMAVDANILIFERIKEEIRGGRPLSIAFENGFGRSWNSIRDANLATLITTFILFNPFGWSFLPSSGPVRGFALTLALGIFTSLFTGVFITRNLIRVFYKK